MKNLAKRLCALALCVLVCAVSALTVAAASETVKIKECEFATDDGIKFVTAAARSDNHIVLIAGVLFSVAYIVRLTC